MALRWENIDATLEELKAKGVRLIDEKPRYGAGGARIAFIHPKSTGGFSWRSVKNLRRSAFYP